jgi:hypothetical protein
MYNSTVGAWGAFYEGGDNPPTKLCGCYGE